MLEESELRYDDYDILSAYYRELERQPWNKDAEYDLDAGLPEQRSNEQIDKLVLGNMRLVVTIANRYHADGMTKLDLIQEGNLGLIRAAQKFDQSLGIRFSTYAGRWISSFIEKAIIRTRSIVHASDKILSDKAAVSRIANQLELKLGRTPTRAEVLAGIPKGKEHLIPTVDVEFYDAPLVVERDGEEMDLLNDARCANQETPEVQILNEELSKHLWQAVSELSDKHQWVLSELLCKDKTILEVSEAMGASRHVVNRVLADAKTIIADSGIGELWIEC